MERRTGTTRRATVAGLALGVLLVGSPATAHPFVRSGEAPADSLATITLAMAHGCGTEQSGGGDPTLEVALEVPDQMRVVEVSEPDGWRVDLDRDVDGRVTVVTWTATTASEPAPDFDLDVVFGGTPGDEVYLRVFQGCEGFAYRWIGTPDAPASDPAIRVVLTDPDPDATPPPEEAPAATESEATEAGGDPTEADEPTEASEPSAADEPADPAPDPEPVDGDAGGPSPVLVALVAAAVTAGVVAGVRWIRTRHG
jgi:YD repeat-containing protein